MAAELTVKVDGVVTTLENVDLSYGVRISDIGAEEEWELTTIDDSPDTFVSPHVGSRPNDR